MSQTLTCCDADKVGFLRGREGGRVHVCMQFDVGRLIESINMVSFAVVLNNQHEAKLPYSTN